MEYENSNKLSNDYQEMICSIQCDVLLQHNQNILNKYFEFCSTRLVLPIFNFNTKQLHLFGCNKSNIEAKKRFFELQTELLVKNSKKQNIEGNIHWWYEAWDSTWQLYNSKITNEIEYNYKLNIFNFTLINQLDENILIDINKMEEIYGQRIKRIRRLKIDEQQPSYWTLTPLNLERFILDDKSDEYLTIKDNFDKTMKEYYTILISIERIQNLRLFKQFCVAHEDFITRYGKKDNGTMCFLYHGCPELASKRIIERGFNRSYCGINGCCYGRGVYFSSNASYSNRYANPNEKKEKRIFYSRVLIGRSMIGHPNIYEPEDGYDTTTDGTHIFVCYYDSQSYPEYLITYT
ncbi:unnamed protein product [Rotaria sordida]|uniref:Poly [ADP-ribose] polymerase n=1 Tax=Rotaria sordida TaxID=392033 RepID=A0A814RBR2_9BILA|nr:unnamed protein product [Rotaria sordida]CAF1355036.1 unnamed protein product [Rotaria sordida]